jgi:hypothetical protein
MIRRGFWLALGAIVGISGYRRLARLARALSPLSTTMPQTARQLAGDKRLSARELGTEAASFVRDVRAGMAEYLDAHDEYMNRHTGRLGNTLFRSARAVQTRRTRRTTSARVTRHR